MNTVAPLSLPPRVLGFCKTISSQPPVILVVQPEPFSQVAECFGNVATKIKNDGGAIIHGWLIWDWPGVFTEAEFHAVWQSPEGKLVDITNPPHRETSVVFLPDSSRSYTGRRVDSIRRAASENRVIKDFIRLCEANFQRFGQIRSGAQIEGREAELYEEFNRAKGFVLDIIRSGANRNAPCLCGGGERYKRCHEPKLHRFITELIGK